MELEFRAALLAWLQADEELSGSLNAIVEEAPSRTALPWLAIAASASTDWSAKLLMGREIRVALELHYRGDDPLAEARLLSAIERRVNAMPTDGPTDGPTEGPSGDYGFRIASLVFLRSRAEQRGEARRGALIEYRARVIAA